MLTLNDYILVVENVVSDSLIDSLLSEYEPSNEWLATTVGANVVDKTIRNCDKVPLSVNDVIGRNFDVRKQLDDGVFSCASKVIKEYNDKFDHCKVAQDTGYEMLRYKEGGFYSEHVDSFLYQPRALSCSFALNDDYEGGEWGFFGRQARIKAPKGSAVIFPSNFMYPHEIMPVTKGTRYSIITWFQ
jgi:hypothetical protein